MSITEKLIEWRNRSTQRRIARKDAKAKRKLVKARIEYLEQVTEQGVIAGDVNWITKAVDADNRVKKPKIDATEDELLETYGSSIYVYACVNAIAEKAASVESQLIDSEGEIQEEDEILHRINNPNPALSGYDLRESTHMGLDLSGNFYWHIQREEGEIIQIKPLRSPKMAVVPDGEGNVIGYAMKVKGWNGKGKTPITQDDFEYALRVLKGQEEIRRVKNPKDGEWKPFEADEIIHFRYSHPYNDYYGMSPLQALLVSVETDLYARSWNKRFFENGAVPLSVISIPEIIDPEMFEDMKEKWRKEHEGVKRAHNTAWLPAEMKIEKLELGPSDVEFLNLMRLSREDIMAAYGVPPVMLGLFQFSNTSSRSAGVEEQRKIFWQDCVIPKLKKIYDRLNLFFYRESEMSLQSDLTNIEALQPNRTEIAKGAKDALLAGLSLNEVREMFWDLGEPTEAVYLPMTIMPINVDGETEELTYQLMNTKKKLNEVERTALWKLYIKKITPLEEDLFEWIKRLFSRQEKRIIDNLNEAWERDIIAETQKQPEDILDIFDFNREVQEFSEEAYEEYMDLMNEHADTVFEDLGIAMTFQISDTRVQNALQNLSFTFADLVNRTTQEQLRGQLSEAIAEGEDIDRIKRRIQDVFSETVRGTAPRARMIARTEIISVTNAGTKEAYRQSKQVIGKEWLSSRDDRVRDTHTAADGQRRKLDSPFQVGGFTLDYPGDPSAPPQERINCRCTFTAILKGEEI